MNPKFIICVADEAGKYTVKLSENGEVKIFDCVYAAETYLKKIGMVKGYKIEAI